MYNNTTSNWASYWSTEPRPSAFITKRKQRLPQSEGLVYLKDQDEFEIELFNPTRQHILAKIKLGGNYISGGGIVLRPGERIFLERFLDTNAKFTYSTYKVNNNGEAINAIALNGYVQIEFFEEETLTSQFSSAFYTPSTFTYYNTSGINLGTFNSGKLDITANGALSSPTGLSLSHTTSGIDVSAKCSNFEESPRFVETGTIEKGAKSSQDFTSTSRNFRSYSFHNVAWQILPESQRVYESKDLKQYCSECGAKIKKSTYKFCPHCGNKIG